MLRGGSNALRWVFVENDLQRRRERKLPTAPHIRLALDTDSARSSVGFTMQRPSNIQLIGNEVAIAWQEGDESYISFSKLRAASPSAATSGERDIFGTLHGGEFGKDYSDVEVTGWKPVGGYAIRFQFSDGHDTGLYTFDMLQQLGQAD